MAPSIKRRPIATDAAEWIQVDTYPHTRTSSGIQGTSQHSKSMSASASAESRLDSQDPLILCEQQLEKTGNPDCLPNS